MTALRRVILMLFLVALLPSCSLKDAVNRMSLELTQVRVKDFSQEGFTATVYLKVNNPNRFGITVREFSYTVYISGDQVAQGALAGEIEIPGNGSVVAELPVKADYAGYSEKLLDKALKGKLDYRLTGEATFGTWFGRYRFPFDTMKRGRPGREQRESL